MTSDAAAQHLLAVPRQLPHVVLGVHAVFANEPPYPHPVRNARISSEVSGTSPVVPYMVERRPRHGGDLRATLGIPPAATVFCSYGGRDSFNTPFVRELLCELAATRAAGWPNRPHVLLANHRPFCAPNATAHAAAEPPRGAPPAGAGRHAHRGGGGEARGVLTHLHNLGEAQKQPFIDACDAMLHARAEGETFGLAVAEFSSSSKPVLAWRHAASKAHLHILGGRAVLYDDRRSLEAQMRAMTRERAASGVWDAFGEQYSPERVMRRFCHVFK